MHLNQVPPQDFATIASMNTFDLQKNDYVKLLEDKAVLQRIQNIFNKSGLVEFFRKHEKQRLNIVSLGAGSSPELSLIESFSTLCKFSYRYFALDNTPEAFRCLGRDNRNPSATFHLVDSSDVEQIQEEIPILEDGSVDVVLLLQPDIEDTPYPFWKMLLDVIPRLSKPQGMILTSFLQHSEVIKFHEYTQDSAIGKIYSVVLCQQTEPIDRYLFASQHQWYATLKLQPDARSYVLSKAQKNRDNLLWQLFCRIVSAPTRGCYTRSSLSDLKEEHISKTVEDERERSCILLEHTRLERRNDRPPYQMFIYENQSWLKK